MTQTLVQQIPEGRIFQRTDVQIEISLGSDHNFYMGFTENISEGGLFVATHSLREVGSEMSIELTLPGIEEPIVARGIVRWLRLFNEGSDSPPGMGLQFIDLTPQGAALIREFVANRSPLFYD
jgi:uncharacterized protein (TIGR02266 family)